MGVLLDLEGERALQICTFMRPKNFWIMSHSKNHLEQMLRDLIQEAEKWDLHRRRRACGGRVLLILKKSLFFVSKTGRHRFPDEDGCTVNRQGKAHEGIEDRMQSANRLGGEMDGGTRPQRLCFGSENWSWTRKHSTESKDGKQR